MIIFRTFHTLIRITFPADIHLQDFSILFFKMRAQWQYILGQPQEVAGILAKLSAGATFVNAIVSTILVVIIYNAVRPALIKANLIHVYVTAANAK